MLANVGGSPDPVIRSILDNEPSSLIFFCSKESRKIVEEKINPALFAETGRFMPQEIIICSDEQDIGLCTVMLLEEVPKALKKLGDTDGWPKIVDYTGGTKTMSAALVWASSKFPCLFNYVGAKDKDSRTKDGLGTVINGKEKSVLLQNPWDQMAYFEALSGIELFNAGQYANSAGIFAKICDKTSLAKRGRRLISVLAEIVQGYSAWDSFEHKDALRLIGKNLTPISDLSDSEVSFHFDLKDFQRQVQANFEFLQQIKPAQITWNLICDLLSNALRRANLEKKYEDATARTYAAIEKIAKHQLSLKYGIDNSNASPEQIPDQLRKNYTEKYSCENKSLQFGAIASFKLLHCLNDVYGERFMRREKIEAHLTERNYSILGHGIQSINHNKFRDLFDDAIFLLNIEETSLPIFPVFRREIKTAEKSHLPPKIIFR